jgi:lipocalin
MNAFQLAALLFCSLALVAAQQSAPEQFQPSQYVGNWFQIYVTKNMPFEQGGTNTVANYEPKTSNSVYVNNYEFKDNRWKAAHGDAVIEDLNMPARLGVRFSALEPRANYIVLYTDYTQMSVVYSYIDLLFGAWDIKYAWILSRTKTLPQSAIDQAFSILQAQTGLTQDKFVQTPQQEGVLPPDLVNTQ